MTKTGKWIIAVSCGCLVLIATCAVLLVVVGVLLWGRRDVIEYVTGRPQPIPESATPEATAPSPEDGEPIICDRFDVHTELQGDTVEVSLDTDLPDDTRLTVWVCRPYKMKGNPSTYSIDYFSDWGTVRQWKAPRRISVNHDLFREEFDVTRKQTAYTGLATEIEDVSDHVQVGLIVPVCQPNPAFGEKNRNLRGKMVSVDTPRGGIRVVTWKGELLYPLDRMPPREVPKVDPPRVEIGHTYRLARGVPVLSSLDLLGAESEWVAPGGQIHVVGVRNDVTPWPWYHVVATGADGKPLAKGWLNSVHLVGQEFETVE